MSDIKKETEATEETVEIPVTDGSEEETAAEAEDTEKESSKEEEKEVPEAEASEEPETKDAKPEEKTKTSFFGKKKKDKFEQQVEELTDRLKRSMAEFDNFRKRTEKEKASMYVIGARDIVEKILPVVDNFERGLATVPEDEKDAPFVDGMNKVYRQLLTELENLGVKPIEAVGKEFDPNFHNAVMQVENDELEPGTVAQELLKGYMYRDTVVRHSMVAVVQE